MVEPEVDHVENAIPTDGCREAPVQPIQAETGLMDDLSRYGPCARYFADSVEKMT